MANDLWIKVTQKLIFRNKSAVQKKLTVIYSLRFRDQEKDFTGAVVLDCSKKKIISRHWSIMHKDRELPKRYLVNINFTRLK